MHLRDDALVKACRIITQLMERTEAASPDMVLHCRTLQVFPVSGQCDSGQGGVYCGTAQPNDGAHGSGH